MMHVQSKCLCDEFLQDAWARGQGRHRSAGDGSHFIDEPQVLPRGTSSGNASARPWLSPIVNSGTAMGAETKSENVPDLKRERERRKVHFIALLRQRNLFAVNAQ